MPPTKTKSKVAGARASAKTPPKVCDLCYDQLEESHEVLVCEGGCNSSVHRYCAGVTRYHYEKLTAGAEPFVCMFCSLKTHRALVSQLQLEVENLKTELASTKTSLQESNQSLTEEMLAVKASMALLLKECNCSTTSSGPVAGGVREKGAVSSNCKQPWNVVVGRRKRANGKGGSGARMPSKSSGSKHNSHASHKNAASGGANQKREVFVGVRRIWGTMKACTATTVSKSITRLTDVGRNVQVKRKYKTNDEGKIVRWWYILHAEEALLKQLEQEWERVQLQTVSPATSIPRAHPSWKQHQLSRNKTVPFLLPKLHSS